MKYLERAETESLFRQALRQLEERALAAHLNATADPHNESARAARGQALGAVARLENERNRLLGHPSPDAAETTGFSTL